MSATCTVRIGRGVHAAPVATESANSESTIGQLPYAAPHNAIAPHSSRNLLSVSKPSTRTLLRGASMATTVMAIAAALTTPLARSTLSLCTQKEVPEFLSPMHTPGR